MEGIEKLNIDLLKEAAENVNNTFQKEIDLEQSPVYLLRDTINTLMPLSKEEQQDLGEVVFDFAANAIEAFGMPKLNQIRDAADSAIAKLELPKDEPEKTEEAPKKDEPDLDSLNMKMLRAKAKDLGVQHINSYKKPELIKKLKSLSAPASPTKPKKKLELPKEEPPKEAPKEKAVATPTEKPKGGKRKEKAGNKVLDITGLVIANPLATQNEIADMLNKAGTGFSLATLNFEYRAGHRFMKVAKELGLWKGE